MVENKVLVHGRKSSYKARVVNNIDFVILLLSAGPLKFASIKQAMFLWRGRCPQYLCNTS